MVYQTDESIGFWFYSQNQWRYLNQTSGVNSGDMQYWDGEKWNILQAGNEDETLIFCNGKPTWGGCLATLNTSIVEDITGSSALFGGEVKNDGGTQIKDKGLVWSTIPNPTVSLSTKKSFGSGKGVFSGIVSGLEKSTTYYVRSYATNNVGTTYGNELSFTTTNIDFNTGLVAYFPFSGNAGDSSGNGYHGTVFGANLTEDRLGVINKAYNFNGIDNRIEVPPFPNGTFNNEFSYSMWVYNLPTNDAQSFFLRQGPNGVSKTWILKYSNIASIRVYNENSYYAEFNSPNLKENAWYHLAVTINSNLACVYVNGVNIGCIDIGFPFSYSQDINLMGNSGGTGNSSYPYNGKMDEIRMYNRILSQAEIKYLAAH
jgi:hypothetical protein